MNNQKAKSIAIGLTVSIASYLAVWPVHAADLELSTPAAATRQGVGRTRATKLSLDSSASGAPRAGVSIGLPSCDRFHAPAPLLQECLPQQILDLRVGAAQFLCGQPFDFSPQGRVDSQQKAFLSWAGHGGTD